MSKCPFFTMNEYHAHDERIADDKIFLKYASPCNDSHGVKMRKWSVIFQHMLKYGHSGISPFPQNCYPNRIKFHSMRDVEALDIDEHVKNTNEKKSESYTSCTEGYIIEFIKLIIRWRSNTTTKPLKRKERCRILSRERDNHHHLWCTHLVVRNFLLLSS